MKNKKNIIAVILLIFLVISTKQNNAAIIELSIKDAAMIQGGCEPSCGGPAGNCPNQMGMCENNQSQDFIVGTLKIKCPNGGGTITKNGSHTMCNGPITEGNCNANAGGEGCGELYEWSCESDGRAGCQPVIGAKVGDSALKDCN